MNTPEQNQTSPTKSREGGSGPVFGIIVIIILLALGGIYYFTMSVQSLQNAPSENVGNGTEATIMVAQEAPSEMNGSGQGTELSPQ
jgi:flagellar basal body-associated protein FliL